MKSTEQISTLKGVAFEMKMKLYNLLKQYVEFDEETCSFITEKELNDIQRKGEYFENLIYAEINKVEDSKELEFVIDRFRQQCIPSVIFRLYNKFFSLNKYNRRIIEGFLEVLYFWGPDYDEDIEIIKHFLKNNELEKASDICMKLRY